MTKPHKCSFSKENLLNSKILFIENNEKIRYDSSEIFSAFFKTLFVAKNKEEVLKIYNENKTGIDIILVDIDFPNEEGIEILSKIRDFDKEVPILITTEFSNMEILLKAIKFNLSNYIVKPIQYNTTLKIMSEILKRKQDKKDLAIKNNELRQFMAILDSCNIICEIDLDFKITSANDSFLINSGYELDELIGLDFKDKTIVNNYESPNSKILELLQNGKTWYGLSKKLTKEGSFYYTHSTILPICFNSGKVKKYIEFSTLISKYENEVLSLKKHIFLLKSENFKTNSELKKEKEYYCQLAKSLQMQIDENVNNAQKLLLELYELKKENSLLKEKLDTQELRFDEFQATIMCEAQQESLLASK